MARIDTDELLTRLQTDRELVHKLRGLTAAVGFVMDEDTLRIEVVDGTPLACTFSDEPTELTVTARRGFWDEALQPVPAPGYESLIHRARLSGDLASLAAPYQGAVFRIHELLRAQVCGTPAPPPVDPEPWRDTDTAVGRYTFVTSDGEEARVYHETAGTGSVPLLLIHTAGGDSRQYRHVLANPALQERFSMVAPDLPHHGRSLPPVTSRWWEDSYRPGKDDLMGWVVGLSEALGLERPIVLGCSMGGHLALDLAAHHAGSFRGFVALNTAFELGSLGIEGINDEHRRPDVSPDYAASLMLAATSPLAPERAGHEVYWGYRSNYPGVYAGDNDYFLVGHDLAVDGHLIDATRAPVYVLAGEYDLGELHPSCGARRIAEEIRGVEYRVLPGLGHFAPTDDPVRFCDQIVPILDEVVSRCR